MIAGFDLPLHRLHGPSGAPRRPAVGEPGRGRRGDGSVLRRGHHARHLLDSPTQAPPANPMLMVVLGTLLFLPIAAALMKWNDAMDILLGVVEVAAVGYMIYLSFKYELVERQRMWVIIVLLFFTAVFWSFFELATRSISSRDFVSKEVSLSLTTTFFQSVNALFIMIFAPVFAWMWVKLAKTGWNRRAGQVRHRPRAARGRFLVLLPKAAAMGVMVPAIFLILLYLLHTLGELALSPVGLSLVTKLAPAKIVGFMMGFALPRRSPTRPESGSRGPRRLPRMHRPSKSWTRPSTCSCTAACSPSARRSCSCRSRRSSRSGCTASSKVGARHAGVHDLRPAVDTARHRGDVRAACGSEDGRARKAANAVVTVDDDEVVGGGEPATARM